MKAIWMDLRFAGREVRRRPGFAVTAVLSLALGIGATSAVFSVIYAVLIDPFPYPGAERMVEMRLVDQAGHDRFAGPSGPQADVLRQGRAHAQGTLMGWWELHTTERGPAEDGPAEYILAQCPQQL